MPESSKEHDENTQSSSPSDIEENGSKVTKSKGGRKPVPREKHYIHISMRMHPKAYQWAKEEAKKRGIGYQTLINEIILAQI
jgi:predicted DNA binding CopG/RHH family protein